MQDLRKKLNSYCSVLDRGQQAVYLSNSEVLQHRKEKWRKGGHEPARKKRKAIQGDENRKQLEIENVFWM